MEERGIPKDGKYIENIHDKLLAMSIESFTEELI